MHVKASSLVGEWAVRWKPGMCRRCAGKSQSSDRSGMSPDLSPVLWASISSCLLDVLLSKRLETDFAYILLLSSSGLDYRNYFLTHLT